MIKKLKRKFVIVAMCSVTIVLTAIITIINITSYLSLNKDADRKLQILVENDGKFPMHDKEKFDRKPKSPDQSPEAPFETRYFSVFINQNKEISETDTRSIAAVNASDAESYAREIQNSRKTKGFKGEYKYIVSERDEGTLIIFLDCSRDLHTFHSFLLTSISIAALGILSVFILVMLFSESAVKPIAESYDKQKRFITDASHELKTPLTIIDANTEVLEMTSGNNEWTTSTKNQIKRLTGLTENLVALARMDESSYAPDMTDFSLSATITDTLEPYHMIAKQKEKDMIMDIEQDINYKGCETLIQELISILADNAIRYSDEHGLISFTLKKHGKQNHLSVYNTVDCIEKGDLNVLFERFYRNDNSRSSKINGYGIGLSLARSIVETHKGKIKAESKDGKSIMIHITL